jgi:hypothetical protein
MGKFNLWGGREKLRFVYAFDSAYLLGTVNILLYYYYGSNNPLLGFDRLFSVLILYTVGRTPWTGDQPISRPLPKHRTT